MSESKLFVGGLSWETTQESLQAYFEKFGEITEVTLKTDANTGRSRGFGFVSFADPASVSQVMSTSTHFLDDRKIDPKVAKAKGGRDGYGEPTLKVFVGGLDPEVPEEEIRAHFSQFGPVEEVDLPFDKVNQQRRAFCFIKFSSEDVVNEVVSKMKQHIGSNEVTVKKATPKTDRNDDFGGGRGGGRGRGRGGYGGGQGGYGNPYGGGYEQQSYGGGQGGYGGGQGGYGGGQGGYGAAYGGAGDDSYGGYGGQQQSRSYHPYQR